VAGADRAAGTDEERGVDEAIDGGRTGTSQAGDAQPGRAARPPSVRRSLAMLVSSFVALVGIVLVVSAYVGVIAATSRATEEGSVPCVAAFSAGTDDAHVKYELAPPRSVCTWSPSGADERVVVAQGSTGLFGTGLALAGVGVAGVVVLLVTGRRRARP
jgi:hypothetical protein